MENSSQVYTEFLPISRADMEARGWEQLDFVVVGGDAYVDHPSFGTAIISRLLEAEGYKVGVLAQPRYTDCEDFKRFGKPKYGFFIGGGNVDSMVSHYSVAKIPRAEDEFNDKTLRAKHNQEIERARQIVRIQRYEIRSKSQIPGILQTSAGSKFV